MKRILPIALLGTFFLSSCSSMYKTGQTPDDVYYSPTRPATGNIHKDENKDDSYTYTEPDDNYLRMKVQNPNRWNTINDADYWYSYNRPYQYTHSNYNWNTWNYAYNDPFWNTGYSYGYYNNPTYYYNPGYYGNYYGGYHPGTIVRNLHSNTGPKPYMGGYTNTTYDNRNINYGNGNKTSGLGNTLRNVFSPTTTKTVTTSNGDTYSRPVRTFSPSTPSTTPSSSSGSNSSSGRSSSSSSSGSSSSSSRPGRGGN